MGAGIKNAPAISIKHWWWRWARRKQGTTVITKVSSKRRTLPTRDVEQQLWAQGYQAVAGVDESGTGALAGPVVAAAAILPPGAVIKTISLQVTVRVQAHRAAQPGCHNACQLCSRSSSANLVSPVADG